MPPIDAQPPIDLGGTTGDAGGTIGEIAGLGDIADSINPFADISGSIGDIASGLTGGPVDMGSDVLDTRAQQNTRGGGSHIVIAPTHLNLGEILQTMSGPPENGGYGVNSPAAGFFSNPTRLNANASNTAAVHDEPKSSMMPILLGVGGVAVVGLVIFLKRGK